MMAPLINGDYIMFSNIPVGEPVQLVSIGVKGQKVVASVEKLTVSAKTVDNIVFKGNKRRRNERKYAPC